jgi:phosphoribosyl-ATP pyrophosphohydrolase
MNDRRRALIALLDQYPLERDLYLHDGRRDVSPRDEFADKIECLFDPSLLDRLWVSSTGLMDRFNANPSIKQALDRMMSEVVELIIAANDTYGTSNDEIAQEAADVTVTLINVLRACGIDQEQFVQACEAVIVKNGLKTDKTHQLQVKTQGVERIGEKVTSESTDPRFQSIAARAMHGDSE